MRTVFLDRKRLLKPIYRFEALFTGGTNPTLSNVGAATVTRVDNGDGTWTFTSNDDLLAFQITNDGGANGTTIVEIISGATILSISEAMITPDGLLSFIWNGECNVTNMFRTFYTAYNIANISFFDTSQVTTMDRAFGDNFNLPSIPEFDVLNCTNFSNAFSGCTLLTVGKMLNVSASVDYSQTSIGNTEMDRIVDGLIDAPSPAILKAPTGVTITNPLPVNWSYDNS